MIKSTNVNGFYFKFETSEKCHNKNSCKKKKKKSGKIKKGFSLFKIT